jgi:two-component system phosphate regulon response regulator PhoB
MKCILLVEDQPDIRKLIRLALESEPWQLHEAVDGPSGVAIAQQLRPEVILMDLMMAGEYGGLEACRRIRADPMLAASTLIVISARGLPADRRAAEEAGADHYLFKPFSPLDLIDLIAGLPCRA